MHCRAFATPSCVLFNREFQPPADGWYQIVPLGEFRNMGEVAGKEQEMLQVIDDVALDAMADGVADELLVDYDHFSSDPEQSSRAAGWITGVQKRTDGLYAQIRWSAPGEADVKGGAFRYISPEFDKAVPLGGMRWRPVRLSGAAITNKPNMKTLKPLSNRESVGVGQINNDTHNIMDYKSIILKVLGLPATASDEEIQAAADKMGGKTAPDLAQSVETINRELKIAREALADADMAGLDLDEGTAKTVRNTIMLNRAGGLQIIAALRKSASGDEAHTRLFNRQNAKPPKTDETLSAAHKAEEARAVKLRNRTAMIMHADHVSFAVAWGRAESEIPA